MTDDAIEQTKAALEKAKAMAKETGEPVIVATQIMPCPFCGAQPTWDGSSTWPDPGGRSIPSLRCESMLCPCKPSTTHRSDPLGMPGNTRGARLLDLGFLREEAQADYDLESTISNERIRQAIIRAWNTRSAPAKTVVGVHPGKSLGFFPLSDAEAAGLHIPKEERPDLGIQNPIPDRDLVSRLCKALRRSTWAAEDPSSAWGNDEAGGIIEDGWALVEETEALLKPTEKKEKP